MKSCQSFPSIPGFVVFEQEYVEQLQNDGIDTVVHKEVNHPMRNVMISENGEVTDSVISESLLEEAVYDVIMPISSITIVKLFFGIF